MACQNEPPWKEEQASGETLTRLVTAFPDYKEDGMTYFGPTRYLAFPDSGRFFNQFYTTPVHEDDVWVVTLPKCGTTWTQELVWLVAHGGDLASARSMLMPDRWHFLEIAAVSARCVRESIMQDSNQMAKEIFFKPIEQRPRPWFVKTHLPLYMCPPQLLDTCKVVYVARNPRDACISYFHHVRLFNESSPNLTLEEFADLFMEGNVSQLPFFPHVLEAWKQRHHPNLLFLFYEDLKKDLRGSIIRVANFMNRELSPDRIDLMERHLQFDSMKNNKWVNREWMSQSTWGSKDSNLRFMRSGCTGDWKKHFTQDMDQKFQRWIDQELAGTDLTFITDIKNSHAKK